MTTGPEERNKQVVARFFEATGGGQLHLLDDLVAEDYIQHNPNDPQGLAGVRSFFESITLPDFGPEEVRFIAEGDFVVRQSINRFGMLVDIFRVQDGKLQEHWDAHHASPDSDPLPGF